MIEEDSQKSKSKNQQLDVDEEDQLLAAPLAKLHELKQKK
jgi:hypothetical protein